MGDCWLPLTLMGFAGGCALRALELCSGLPAGGARDSPQGKSRINTEGWWFPQAGLVTICQVAPKHTNILLPLDGLAFTRLCLKGTEKAGEVRHQPLFLCEGFCPSGMKVVPSLEDVEGKKIKRFPVQGFKGEKVPWPSCSVIRSNPSHQEKKIK